MIRIFTRQIEKLGNEEGQALVFVAMVGLVIFLFFAMSMNLAELVNTKIKSQNATDAVAISGAVWQARAFNMMAATNENLLNLWSILMINFVAEGLLFGICLLACQPGPGIPLCLVCIAAMLLALLAIRSLVEPGQGTTLLQSRILNGFDRELLEHDLGAGPQNILERNYAFKQNTKTDEKASFYFAYTGQDSNEEEKDKLIYWAFRRANWCELLVSILYYFSWQICSDGEPGCIEAQWGLLRPLIEKWYTDGSCDPGNDLLERLPEEWQDLAPYVLATKVLDPTNPNVFIGQDIEALLPITVGTYKEQEAPALLGKGSGPPDCLPEPPGDSRFPCPDSRHYSFASAHAFSESVSRFYNLAVRDFAVPDYPIPLVPFKMDWEARLFPIERYVGVEESPYEGWNAYEKIVLQMEDHAGGGVYDFVVNNLLWAGGRRLFLY